MTASFDLEKFVESRVLIVGDLMLDRYLWGDVDRISPEAPVPIFHITNRSDTPGGAGNVVSNLVGLGSAVTVVGIIGNDAPGQQLKTLLQNSGAEVNIVTDPGRATITKTRVVSQGQQLLRLDEEETVSLTAPTRDKIIGSVTAGLGTCNAVILSDYGKGLLQTKELAQTLIGLAKDRNVPVIIDPKGKDWERYRGATCVTPNTKELEQVCGEKLADEKQLVQAMRSTLIKYDLDWLVVTRGSLGLCLMDRSEAPVFVPALAKHVYDVSGAGDTVIATLALGVGSGFGFQTSAKIANLAAGIVVGKIGTQAINLFELKASLKFTGLDAHPHDITHKIAGLRAAVMQVEAWKANRQKIVFTNGCFDLLHPGHIHLLKQARDLGDRLIVAINSDDSVRGLKGPTRPRLTEHDRASLLASLSCVDLVMIFEAQTPKCLLNPSSRTYW